MSRPGSKHGTAAGIWCLVGAALAVGLFFYTSNKLDRMRMIRGDLPGATILDARITDKYARDGSGMSTAYWLEIEYTHKGNPGSDRVNLQAERWQKLNVGDTVEIAILPGETEPYITGGIYVSDSNMMFDKILRIGEMIGAIVLFLLGALFLYAGWRSRAETN